MSLENNKKILSNTLFMYFRMFFSLFVSLYTSRVVLQELGVEDFGIYSVVGGVVAMLSFLNASMGTATSRFFNFEIGQKGDIQTVFTSALIIHLFIAILVMLAGAGLGHSVVFEYLNIDATRLEAAKWVYGLSLLTACMAVLQIPYSAMIVSYEHFKTFAYLDAFAVLLKLCIVYFLSILGTDRLITYATLVFGVSCIIFIGNACYVMNKFDVSHFKPTVNNYLIKKMLSFSGWDLYGNASVLARTQGVNILLNLFFGALLNAASGIAMQVQGAVMSFAVSALSAVRPQIVKSYASGDYQRTTFLVLNAAKFTYFILLMVSLPLILEMDYVLTLWLGNVPEFAVIFCQYILIFNFIANLSTVVVSAIHATGHIKRPSIINGTLYLLVVPITYVAYLCDYPAQIAYQVNIAMVIIGMLSNAWTLNLLLPSFSFVSFINKVILPCAGCTILVVVVAWLCRQQFEPSFYRLCLVSLASVLTTIIAGYYFAIDSTVRKTINHFILNKIKC
ncbi:MULTISPECIES: polysaccharide biosynthesis protein [unclassified Shewanella]|uniref:polysaccharide biosynthesis protein n=1 Tax=unclassified Shewanella TaxID=196818 RepID=UPI002005C731|nr:MULTISPECIES: polysaccharide biosynthesis protein [unclassified Shewanella]MCK7634366.1 polysaccharide biosynthesis protein [Shewanella sp. JNE17]MCK7649634.1 polysaccharide biosynthesis protein [Shewanella sp. JNE8]MCK7657795.1 polysaccharide biosynthesis protein [Shewanella sp. JNE4-2]UPO30009.1 polysaccharide biosynthesis protein [Shewanella sp. JNE2]